LKGFHITLGPHLEKFLGAPLVWIIQLEKGFRCKRSALVLFMFDLKLANKSNSVGNATQIPYLLTSRNSKCLKITQLLGWKRTIIYLLEHKLVISSHLYEVNERSSTFVLFVKCNFIEQKKKNFYTGLKSSYGVLILCENKYNTVTVPPLGYYDDRLKLTTFCNSVRYGVKTESSVGHVFHDKVWSLNLVRRERREEGCTSVRTTKRRVNIFL